LIGSDSISGALASLTYGIYVLTVEGKAEIHAMVVTWVTQVSFDPPLVALSVESDAVVNSMLGPGSGFELHVLPADGVETAKFVLKHGRLRVSETTAEGTSESDQGGSRETRFVASLQCMVQQVVRAGDHIVYIGKVEGVTGTADDTRPLTLRETGWKYRKKRRATE
jgi:flavin reductase (DIM6/NTAB) family NADH-FMN oxidoreductase RutF